MRTLLVAIAVVGFASAGMFGTARAQTTHEVTLKGQVVCSSCWFEADRKTVAYGTEADLKCAARCGKGGMPGALAVTENGETTLYLIEGTLPAGDGGKAWMEFAGQQVEATGVIREDGQKHYLKVSAVKVVPASAG